jgi:hypothetical protein
VRREAEAGLTQAITQRPNGRTDHDSDELREPLWTPKDCRHRVGSWATREDIRPRKSLLDDGLRNNPVPVQPEFTLLDSFEPVRAAAMPGPSATCARLRRFTVRVTPLTLPRIAGPAMRKRSAASCASHDVN